MGKIIDFPWREDRIMSARVELRRLISNPSPEQTRPKKKKSGASSRRQGTRYKRLSGPLVLIQGGGWQTVVVNGDLYIVIGGEGAK